MKHRLIALALAAACAAPAAQAQESTVIRCYLNRTANGADTDIAPMNFQVDLAAQKVRSLDTGKYFDQVTINERTFFFAGKARGGNFSYTVDRFKGYIEYREAGEQRYHGSCEANNPRKF